jgi:hypothetical protein
VYYDILTMAGGVIPHFIVVHPPTCPFLEGFSQTLLYLVVHMVHVIVTYPTSSLVLLKKRRLNIFQNLL